MPRTFGGELFPVEGLGKAMNRDEAGIGKAMAKRAAGLYPLHSAVDSARME